MQRQQAEYDEEQERQFYLELAYSIEQIASWCFPLELTDPLPEGLDFKRGRIVFDCGVCGAETEWPDDPLDFLLGEPGNVCGGSPRCCP